MRHIFLTLQRTGCLLMVLLFVPVFSNAGAQRVIKGREREQYVRVCLTRLGERERLDFTFSAPYELITENGAIIYFHAGSEVTFRIENEQIYLYYQQMSQLLGTRASLVQASGSADRMSGFYLTHFPALYMGDLQLDVVQSNLRAILSIHVEDYLLGVVPYEMGDSFPLEALKAQAVAARTYALCRQNPKKDYDLVDNTNDQVFKGYLPGNTRSEKAVEETRGICGFYQGELAQCFYSASNGGQTELVQTVWSSRQDYAYYAFGEDPYDVANPESVVRRFQLLKRYPKDREAPYALRQMLAEQLWESMKMQGDPLTADHVQIDGVTAVSVDTPSAPGSRHMTNLHMELAVSIRQDRLALQTEDTSPEEVHLVNEVFFQPADEPLSQEQPASSSQKHTFVAFNETVSLDVPIFPQAERIFSMDISGNYQNEIWSVVEDGEGFFIEARRFGHGVGMSQRGAQWMASEYGMTYEQILAFYYPGMDLIVFPEQERRFAEPQKALAAFPGPAPTPTPRPTLMPATQTAQEGQSYATVTGIAGDSSLNLRAEPNLNGDVLTRLYKGQRLLVLERCLEEGWVHVRTDVIEGYVMEKFLTREGN